MTVLWFGGACYSSGEKGYAFMVYPFSNLCVSNYFIGSAFLVAQPFLSGSEILWHLLRKTEFCVKYLDVL